MDIAFANDVTCLDALDTVLNRVKNLPAVIKTLA